MWAHKVTDGVKPRCALPYLCPQLDCWPTLGEPATWAFVENKNEGGIRNMGTVAAAAATGNVDFYATPTGRQRCYQELVVLSIFPSPITTKK